MAVMPRRRRRPNCGETPRAGLDRGASKWGSLTRTQVIAFVASRNLDALCPAGPLDSGVFQGRDFLDRVQCV